MALSVSPSQYWGGIDGSWSTFVLNMGTPSMDVDVFISTSETIAYPILPFGCDGQYSNTTCKQARGGFYDPNNSTTWTFKGYYSLDVDAPLDVVKYPLTNDYGKAEYGYDVVSLGYQGGGGPTLSNQTIGAMINPDLYLGLFGILPKPFNVSELPPIPSFLQMLKDVNKTASLSWGYTAGAPYQLNGVFGSLTISGYDANKFVTNDVSFPMSDDPQRYMTVNVQSIGISGSQGATPNVLDSSIPMFIDSTLPYLWLPQDVCDKFSDAFNLSYDNSSGLYLVSNSSHAALTASNPSVTFTLSTEATGGNTVQIQLPYAAFDLIAQPPLLTNQSNYFPIRVAENQGQYALGRAFLQEAYIIADFERNNFSVSQALFQSGAPTQLVTILPPGQPATVTVQPAPGPSGLSGGAIAGIVVGVIAGLALIAAALFWFWWRPRRAAQKAANAEKPISSDDDRPPQYSPAAYDQTRQQNERQSDHNVSEMPGEGLPNSTKNRGELDGTESPRLRGYYSPTQETAEVDGTQPYELGTTRGSKQEYIRDDQQQQQPQRPEPERQISQFELPGNVTRNNSRRMPEGQSEDVRASVVNPAEAESHPLPVRDGAVSPTPDVNTNAGTFLSSPVDEPPGDGTERSGNVSTAVSPVTNPTGLGSSDARRLSLS